MVSGCKLNLKSRVKNLLTKKTKIEAEKGKDFSRKFHLLQLDFWTHLPTPMSDIKFAKSTNVFLSQQGGISTTTCLSALFSPESTYLFQMENNLIL